MNEKIFAKIILISVVVFLVARTPSVYAVPAAPNETNITAEVLEVQQIDQSSDFASDYVAILKIKVIKYKRVEGVLSVPDELEVLVSRRNDNTVVVNNFEKGQIITAALYLFGDERSHGWRIGEVEIAKNPINAKAPLYKNHQILIPIGGGVLTILLATVWLFLKEREKMG